MSHGARLLTVVLALVLVLLQVRLWTGAGSRAEIASLQARVATQAAGNRRLAERNTLLAAEVRALKNDPSSVEARARAELGMIREGEVFYMVLPRPAPPRASGAVPGA